MERFFSYLISPWYIENMTLKTRDKLIALGPEKLADALLELGSRYDEADELVERMVATPGEKMKRFKAKLSGLKRARSFIDWREVGGFARKLQGLLVDLEESVTDGKTGVELVARFLNVTGMSLNGAMIPAAWLEMFFAMMPVDFLLALPQIVRIRNG